MTVCDDGVTEMVKSVDGVMVKPTLAVRIPLASLAVTVSPADVGGVESVVRILRASVPSVNPGLKVACTPAGTPLTLNLTTPARAGGLIAMEKLVPFPEATVCDPGVADTEKSMPPVEPPTGALLPAIQPESDRKGRELASRIAARPENLWVDLVPSVDVLITAPEEGEV